MAAASGAAALAGGGPTGGFSSWKIGIEHDPTVQAEALVYSVPERRWVGSVGVSYYGKHPGKAMTRRSPIAPAARAVAHGTGARPLTPAPSPARRRRRSAPRPRRPMPEAGSGQDLYVRVAKHQRWRMPRGDDDAGSRTRSGR